jgi:inositol phosphorylceramide mannosyltransferase catalytic subunit
MENGLSPENIHLVWLGPSVPHRVAALKTRLESLHPDATVRLWRDGDLTWMKNHELLLREPRMSGKADIARYEILLQHGGIYLDCDFSVHRSLGPVFDAIEQFEFVAARQSRALYNPAFVGAQAGHAVLQRLVAGMPLTMERFMSLSAVARTGPDYFTEVLMSYLRAGGRFGELPQHVAYPWFSDEAPLPPQEVPPSVIISHEWATMSGMDYWASPGDEDRRPQRSFRQSIRKASSLRGRAARSPAVHDLVRRLEDAAFRGGPTTRLVAARAPKKAAPGASRLDSKETTFSPTQTDRAMDAWSARLVARTLRGSDNFLDLWPRSVGAFITATRVLGRTGRAILVTTSEAGTPRVLVDESVRCSTHLLLTAQPGQDRVESATSFGSALRTREISQSSPPLGHVDDKVSETVGSLVSAIPRFGLVRVSAQHATAELCSTLDTMIRARRIRRLLLLVDPRSPAEGTARLLELVEAQEADGREVSIGPWIVDGRGRKWWEHLRIASRPFAILVSDDNA